MPDFRLDNDTLPLPTYFAPCGPSNAAALSHLTRQPLAYPEFWVSHVLSVAGLRPDARLAIAMAIDVIAQPELLIVSLRHVPSRFAAHESFLCEKNAIGLVR